VGAAITPRILLVDDQRVSAEVIRAYLTGVQCEILTAQSGTEALAAAAEHSLDLILLDAMMPDLDGFEVCRRIKHSWATRLVPVVMVTGLDQKTDRIRALDAGADDFLTKPVDRTELLARVRSLLRVKTLFDELDDAERVIFALARAVDAKDRYTEAHTERVASNSKTLGDWVGLSSAELDAVYRGAMIHDIGKIGVPDAILMKPGKLDPDEREQMKLHPVIGEEIARPLRSAATLLPIIRHHHENVDGTGYPDGLRGDEISTPARIVAICDAFDAIISDRPYRRGRAQAEALRILAEGAGTHWDAELVAVFTNAVGEGDLLPAAPAASV
jgi:putative two-component system response regulator